MKKLTSLVLIAGAAMLAGCANAPVKPIPPQQLIADFCPVVNADLGVLAKSPLLLPGQQATLAGIATVNQAVCAAGAAIDITDLQKLNATAFPALIELVTSIPAIPDQPAILLGLTLAQPILAQVAAQMTPAAAPVAASQ